MTQKVLIIRPGALGDTLVLLPALKNIGNRVHLMVAGREPGISFLKKAGFYSVNMEGGGWYRVFQENPDSSAGLSVPPQNRVVAYMSDPDGRINENLKAYFPAAEVTVLSAYPAPEKKTHVARYLCTTLAEAGLPVDPDCAMEQAKKRPLIDVDAKRSSEDRIVVHPGSGSPRKNFPPDFWVAFIERISREPAMQVKGKRLVLLGPAEKDLRDFFRERISGASEVAFCPRNEELLPFLETARLYAGHDSGVTHLAAMLGTPTLAVFREDNLPIWHPLGPVTRVIQSSNPDEACLEKMVDAAKALIRRKRNHER